VAHPEHSKADTAEPQANVFRREGHFWTLAYTGTLVQLRDSKGLRDIARLLECAGGKLHVVELARPGATISSCGPDALERARVAVTMRIRSAIARIEKEHHALGRHLSHSIETGRFCSYEPESPFNWTL
jgi:hypothetical protein